ncbi:hypothetical protein EVAR_50602_1 [Eumeta japonica]|uniref:Uncharacterized protein n=1 Tax=Eumeta variegata TaxID=151549 RepID=A0A4C1Y9J1_EUMVA|nr:hypothetical protein EVAR_50602_1 [Eumeta japonica]
MSRAGPTAQTSARADADRLISYERYDNRRRLADAAATVVSRNYIYFRFANALAPSTARRHRELSPARDARRGRRAPRQLPALRVPSSVFARRIKTAIYLGFSFKYS